MLAFYVLFTVSCRIMQSDGYELFAYGNGDPMAAAPFDFVLRGGFVDIIEHFEFSASPIVMNRANG